MTVLGGIRLSKTNEEIHPVSITFPRTRRVKFHGMLQDAMNQKLEKYALPNPNFKETSLKMVSAHEIHYTI